MPVAAWYRDAAAVRFIAKGYVPWLVVLSLAWELLQLPLYTIWEEGSAAWIAFAVAHCTAGDVLIGLLALVLALIATRAGPMSAWHWRAIGLLLAALGIAYTAWSEWMNTVLRPAWAYSRWMPTLSVGGVALGLSPLLQWLLLPPLALLIGKHRR